MWVSDDGEEVNIISSIKIEERTGVSPITDLHRDTIDDFHDPECEGQVRPGR